MTDCMANNYKGEISELVALFLIEKKIITGVANCCIWYSGSLKACKHVLYFY